MALPVLVPLGLLILGGLAYNKISKTDGASVMSADIAVLTADQAVIYDTALNKTEDPETIRKMAAVFRKKGFEPHAIMLEKRANLRELPQEVKRARRAAFRKAMKSTNREGILAMAAAYDKAGAPNSADSLRTYAAGLP